jgi:hypothetical protein
VFCTPPLFTTDGATLLTARILVLLLTVLGDANGFDCSSLLNLSILAKIVEVLVAEFFDASFTSAACVAFFITLALIRFLGPRFFGTLFPLAFSSMYLQEERVQMRHTCMLTLYAP